MTAIASTLALTVVLLGAGAIGHRLLSDLRSVPFGTPASDPRPPVDVSVIIPARNEADRLPQLLRSLQLLSPSPLEVLVVDDSSQDDTSGVAGAGGALVLEASTPPQGWTGKAWACQQGADLARGNRLMFLDADTELAPGALVGLLDLHHVHGGLLSVQPHHVAVHAVEQLSAYFNVVSLMASGAFAHRPPRVPMAFGPCLLTSRADYEVVGGHAVVRSDILDDAGLAAAYARCSLPVTSAIGGASVRMRMYPGGWRQLAEGWTKNIASGAARADRRSSIGAAVWVAAQFAVAVGGILSVLDAVTGSTTAVGAPVVWLAAWVAVTVQLRGILRRIGSFRWWAWLLFPVPLAVFGALFLWSLLLTFRRGAVRWRGRTIPVAGHSPRTTPASPDS